MIHVLFLLHLLVLSALNTHSPGLNLKSDTLCYEHIRIRGFEVALNWNSKFSAPPYYLYLKVDLSFKLQTNSFSLSRFYYHLRLTPRACSNTMKFILDKPDIKAMNIRIDFMTNYDGIVLTTVSLTQSDTFSFGTYKVADIYSMLELYVNFEEYKASREVQQVMPRFDKFPKSYISGFVKERAPRHEYVCASANQRFILLKLVSNFNGPAVNYFGSISVVIFRNKRYVHSETWNAWPYPSWNAISPISPRIVIQGSTDDVEVFFRKNKIGEPDSIDPNVNYNSFTLTHTFSYPSLQIASLSTIASPWSELNAIYAMNSGWLSGTCQTDSKVKTYVRQTSDDSIQVQKYFQKLTDLANIKVVKYEPFKEASC